jgi:hypothetical protein
VIDRIQHLALPFALAAITVSAVGQQPRFFRTRYGSSFLIVPLTNHSLTWVNLQPSGPREEPPGGQGLGLAIAQASLFGTARADQSKKTSLNWEKALRSAPSSGSRIIQIEDYVGVAVTFPKQSLGRVARLLQDRTQRKNLTGVPQLLERVRAERTRRLRTTPHLGMMRRAVAAFESTSVLLQALANHSTTDIAQADIESFYRETYNPARSLNIITGNFSLIETERQIKTVFRGQEQASQPAKVKPDLTKSSSSSQADAPDTLMLGCPVPTDLNGRDLVTLDLLVEYLAGDEHAYLPDHLRSSGHPTVRVRAQAPFPTSGGIFLISVTKPGARLEEEDNLTVHIEQALAKIATDAPDSQRLARAVAALQADRSTVLRGSEGLASLLARRWIRSGVPPVAGLTEDDKVSAVEFRDLAQHVFALAGQTLILPKLGK